MKESKYNPWGGVKTTYWLHDDSFIVRKEVDVQPYLDAAAEMRAITRGEKWGETRKIAHIDPVTMGRLAREGILYNDKRLDQWLRENPKYCTFEKALL